MTSLLIWLMQPHVWRFVGFASTVVGLCSYALSSSFNHLFGCWNFLKFFLYTVSSIIISLAVLFAKLWQYSGNVRFRAHVLFLVLTITSVYSFFYDRAVNQKPDAYGLISCAAFAIASLSLSRQTRCGYEVELLYFFLGALIIQLMKVKLLFGIVGVLFGYSLVILRSSLDSPSDQNGSMELQDQHDHFVVVRVDSQQSMPPQPNNCVLLQQLFKRALNELVQAHRVCLNEYLADKEDRTSLGTVKDCEIVIHALPAGTIGSLHELARRMVAGGLGKECLHVYSSCRREVLEESLSRLGFRNLCFEEAHETPWQELDGEIERWIEASIASLKFLFPCERRLCDSVFFEFSSAADLSFVEICRGSAVSLLNFADAVVVGGRSSERLFKILDVFETLRDLIPEFETLFSDQYGVFIRNEAIRIWKRLGDVIGGVFMELENLLRHDPVKAEVTGSGLHPITCFVLNCLDSAPLSREMVEQVFEDYGHPLKDYPKLSDRVIGSWSC